VRNTIPVLQQIPIYHKDIPNENQHQNNRKIIGVESWGRINSNAAWNKADMNRQKEI
jgi:hypothetical protein